MAPTRGLAALALFGLVAGGGQPAGAYVRAAGERTRNGVGTGDLSAPFRWLVSCIPISPDARGSRHLPLAVIEETLQRSVTNWNEAALSCSYLRLFALPAGRVLDLAADRRPAVIFRDDAWVSRRGEPRDPAAIALTTTFFINNPGAAEDGTVLDADIEMNGVHFTFTTDPVGTAPRPDTTIADLENTLTHELGHVLGFAHTCFDGTTPEPLLDDQGLPSPSCFDPGQLPAAIRESTMYPYSETPQEIEKRTPTPDDVRGLCEVYPSTLPPPGCFLSLEGGYGAGCSHVPGAPPSPVAPILVLTLTLSLALPSRRR